MNAREIKKTLTEYLAIQVRDHNEHLTIMEALKPLEGKKLDMRAQRLLPDGYVIRRNFNGYEVATPTNTYPHFICYFSSASSFSIEEAGRCNAPYNNGAKERAEKIKAILDDPEKLKTVTKKFIELDKTYRKLRDLYKELNNGEFDSYNFPVHHKLITQSGMNSRILSDIIYNG